MLWIEVGALNSTGNGARQARLPISSKPDFDRIYQILTDNNFASRLEIRCFATAGRRTCANLVAVKVFIQGQGENADSAEALFTPTQFADQTLVLVQPGTGLLTYSYRVMGYNRQGIPVTGISGLETSLNLLVPLPVV